MILLPTCFKTDMTRGAPILVPIVFEDPDGFSGAYQVTLDAMDDVSAIEIGHVVTNDDVMKLCTFERPCMLNRSTNQSSTNATLDDMEDEDHQLHIVIPDGLLNPSHFEVYGSKRALQLALSEMIIRDWTMWTWDSPHRAEF